MKTTVLFLLLVLVFVPVTTVISPVVEKAAKTKGYNIYRGPSPATRAERRVDTLVFGIDQLADKLDEQRLDTVRETRGFLMGKRRREADIAALRTDLGDAIRAQRALDEDLHLADELMLERA